MKCPLIISRVHHDDGGDTAVPVDCLKEECAWWDKEHDMCCIAHIGDELGEIQWELQRLHEDKVRGLD